MTLNVSIVSTPVSVALTNDIIAVSLNPTTITASIASVGPQGPPGPQGGYIWSEVTGPTQGQANYAYVTNNASLVSVTLPLTAPQFALMRVVGKGAGGWSVLQNPGQTIHFSGESTTTGTAGSVSSQEIFDVVELVCITANTDWEVISCIGNVTLN